MKERNKKNPKRITFITNDTAYLVNFRLKLMIACVDRGYDVYALGPGSQNVWGKTFNASNITYRVIPIERTGTNPFTDLRTLIYLFREIKAINPEKMFVYTAKPIVYGNIAGRLNGVKEIYSLVTGLGSILHGTTSNRSIIRKILKQQYRLAFSISKKIFVQNPDDARVLVSRRIARQEKLVLINGSGVDLDYFRPVPLPEKPAFIFVGRLLKDKGIIEYLDACCELKKCYPKIRCLLVGARDSNPSSIKEEELKSFVKNQTVEYYGHQLDVRPFVEQCCTLVLPSYHEGTPRSVLEAMAMGRSIITSDAPGCRETVKDGYNGYLIEVGNSVALFDKMRKIVADYPGHKFMGNNSLSLVREKFDVRQVNRKILEEMEI